MIQKISILSDLNDPHTYFYLSLMNDRLDSANERWSAALERRFGRRFRPIYLRNNAPNEIFARGHDYIVINRQPLPDGQVRLLSHDDENEIASREPFINELIGRLADKQGKVFVLALTSSSLDFPDARVSILGPDPAHMRPYESKPNHLRLFRELGILGHEVAFYENYDHLVRAHANYPGFVSASFSSSGAESTALHGPEDTLRFGKCLRSKNLDAEFVVSELIPDIVHSPTITAMVAGDGDIRIIAILDQILDGNSYRGNIYPGSTSHPVQGEMRRMTHLVGAHMSKAGFRGLFGMDFMLDSRGRLLPIDLNPRRQGSYIPIVLMSQKIDLVEQECRIIFGEPLESFSEADIAGDFAWGMARLPLLVSEAKAGVSLLIAPVVSSPPKVFENIGSHHFAIYYPSGSRVFGSGAGGYFVSAHSREIVDAALETEPLRLSSMLFDVSSDEAKLNTAHDAAPDVI